MHRFIPAAAMLALTLTPSVQAQPQPTPSSPRQCFFSRDFRGWRSPDPSTIYIRVGGGDYYVLGLAAACPQLSYTTARLVTSTHGVDSICSPLDWDLSVTQSGAGGLPTPCIVSTMRKLSEAEVAAIPPQFRP